MGSGRGSGTRRQPKEKTRKEILAAARAMVTRDGIPERADVRLADVLDELGLTTGAAYNIWGSQESFQRDLALHVLSDYAWAGYGQVEVELDVTAADPYDELRRLAEGYLDHFAHHDAFFDALRYWGVREPSAELLAAIQAGYRSNYETWRSFYDLGLAWAGRRMKPEFSLDDLVTAVMAATEGAAVRQRFDPDPLKGSGGQSLHAEMLVAIVDWFTEPVDDG